ncbi:hypothetical protein ACFOTA_11890 [Chitinophaga sp. GCM10012297]|uniref:Uncharacterized protein n=1 Tax=Chitinophaga chungangae TaxID=2821488 RepID=A0ABS3YE13_9BACT|nr:hypothetical protein [Chitinophaga chungangae]MBO9152911.1 hypothetical protein [Chitinophaga chungangae]
MKRLLRPDFQLYLLAFLLTLITTAIILSPNSGFFEITDILTILIWSVLFICFEALFYYATRHYRQYRWLQYFHIATTFILAAFYIIIFLKPEQTNFSAEKIHALAGFDPVEVFITLLFFAGQAAFVFNLIAGFIRGSKNIQK